MLRKSWVWWYERQSVVLLLWVGIFSWVSQAKEVGKKVLLRSKSLFVEQWGGCTFARFERSLHRVGWEQSLCLMTPGSLDSWPEPLLRIGAFDRSDGICPVTRGFRREQGKLKKKKKRVQEQMRKIMGAEEMQMRRGLRGRGAISGEQQKAETVGVVTWLEPWTWTRPRGGMRLWKEGTLQKPARCQSISRGIRCRQPWKGIYWSPMRVVHVSKVEAEEEEVDEDSKIEHKIWEQKNHFFL